MTKSPRHGGDGARPGQPSASYTGDGPGDPLAQVLSDMARSLQAQYETGQGPCLDATYERRTVRLANMATESRWPEFSRRALELGVRSMLSFQLYVRDNDLGALNLYSGQVDAFDDESENVGLLFASHAAVAMAGSQREHHLSLALSARDLIGQA